MSGSTTRQMAWTTKGAPTATLRRQQRQRHRRYVAPQMGFCCCKLKTNTLTKMLTFAVRNAGNGQPGARAGHWASERR